MESSICQQMHNKWTGQSNPSECTTFKKKVPLIVLLMRWGQSERWSCPVRWRGPGTLHTGPVKVSPGRPTHRSTLPGPCASAGSLSPALPPHTHCPRLLLRVHTYAPSPRQAPPERRRTHCPSWCPPKVWGRGAYLVDLEISHKSKVTGIYLKVKICGC